MFVRTLETGRKASCSSLFRSECKLILYLTRMYVHCVYPAISETPKHLPNCLKIAETSVVLVVFNEVICDVSAYTVTVSFCRSTWIRYQKCFIRSMSKHWSAFDPLYQYSKSHNCRINIYLYTIVFTKVNHNKDI